MAGLIPINELGLIVEAWPTPEVAALMDAFRAAQQAVAADEPRVRKLPRPWLGDPHHHALEQARNAARGRAITYLVEHQNLIVVNGRCK